MTAKFHKELKVSSTTDNLSKIRDFIKSSAQECGFSDEAIGKIILAVDEAATNVIKHAYKYSPDGEINLQVKFEDNKFIVSLIDKGKHFDSSLVPEPNLAEYHRKRKVGGLGIFLMRKLMDEVEYKQIRKNKNQVRLVKYLT